MQTKKELPNLAEYAGEDRVISSHELDLMLQERKKDFVNVKSKIQSLDDAVEGFRDGELIVISGPTKNGKTLLAQTLTMAFIQQQQFPIWFSFEVPARQFLSQFPSLPMFYLPKILKAHALKWVEDRVQESFLKYHTRIVFIDHLHFLFDMARMRNPSMEIGTVIRALKIMAVQNNFVIFLLCHTTKGKFSAEDDLSYDSIRDSSFTAQESDCVMMVRRDKEHADNAAKLRIEFHRRTGVMEQRIFLRKENGFFVEDKERKE